ncbi:MAG: MFS transporter, partial [Planctomycetes bacterium]|nr:MFS transporter [Planctomycetota bacterium]
MAGLRAHLISSFTGAANDNLFKQVIAVSLLGLARQQLGPGQGADRRGELYVLLAGAAFLLPFVLLAPLAGALGDRLPKHLVMRAMRAVEIPLCVLGGVGLWLNSLPMMILALAGLATQSAIFAPVKLSLMPDLVAPERLARANALLQTVTLVAIVGGSALAFSADERFLAYLPFAMAPGAAVLAIGVFLAVIGLCAAWRVPALPAAAPDTRLRVFDLFGSLRRLFQTRPVVAPAISLALFWGLAAAAHLMIVPAADQAYHLGQAGNPLFGLALIAGIVVGSLLAPRLVSPAYPAGLPLLGAAIAAVGLIIAGLVAHAPGSHPASFGAWLVITGIGAGLWEIPLQVLVISRAPAASRNQIQAAAGILGSMVMISATGVCWVLTQVCDLRAALVLTALGSVTLITAAGFTWCYRQQVAAWAMARLVGVIYRVRVEGTEHFPASGGCLVVCNHLSYADGVVLAANLPRPGRFLVYRRFVDLPVIGWGLRAAGVIPVAAEDARRAMLASIDAAVEAASRGEVVVIFPEGKITRGNQLDAFRSGMERIASRAHVPVVPVHLDGLWGALASRAKVRTFIPLRRVVLRIGSPMPSDVVAAEARNQVMTLSYEQAQERAERDHRTLGHAVLAAARRHPTRVAVRDAGGRLSFLG